MIVAEIGSTWRRAEPKESKEAALKSVRMARTAGADAVKFQLFTADQLYNRDLAPKQWASALFHELPPTWIPLLQREARLVGIELHMSVFDIKSLIEAAPYVQALKLASGDLGPYSHTLFDRTLQQCRIRELPFCVSTGTHDRAEIEMAVDRALYDKLVIYNCVSAYPATVKDYNLEALLEFRDRARIGLSDHMGLVKRSFISRAVELGYTWFEAHFRLDECPKNNPDYGHSLAPGVFEAYVRTVNEERQRWFRPKTVNDKEFEERQWMWRDRNYLRPWLRENDAKKHIKKPARNRSQV